MQAIKEIKRHKVKNLPGTGLLIPFFLNLNDLVELSISWRKDIDLVYCDKK